MVARRHTASPGGETVRLPAGEKRILRKAEPHAARSCEEKAREAEKDAVCPRPLPLRMRDIESQRDNLAEQGHHHGVSQYAEKCNNRINST